MKKLILEKAIVIEEMENRYNDLVNQGNKYFKSYEKPNYIKFYSDDIEFKIIRNEENPSEIKLKKELTIEQIKKLNDFIKTI